MNKMNDDPSTQTLKDYLVRIPAVFSSIGSGVDNGLWWVKFRIDITHPLAWNVIQELGHVLNYLSVEEKLPTSFKPVSPPPYLNGGPKEFLSWVIESKDISFRPETCVEWLESRLPRPVDDQKQWEEELEED
jgi:hypothetical protein